MKQYTTKSGDMWDSIAYTQLGSEFYANQLINANLKYSNIMVFDANIVLNIPVINIEDSKVNLPPWKRK